LPGAPATQKEIEQVLRYARQKKTKARFYADEDVPRRAVEIHRNHGLKVLTAGEAGMLGHPDGNHAAFALRTGRVLVTCDRDYLDDRRFPLISCPAIVVFDFGNGTRTEIIRAFRCLGSIIRFPQFFDKWARFDATPDEWVERLRFLDGTTSRERCRMFRGRRQLWR
jgi:predicted nuclease of predicted toxin-antitoxin system